MISKDKTYRTRDGREVRIYATDGRHPFPIHGAVSFHGRWDAITWTENGCESQEQYCSSNDLFEVKPRIKRTVWLNVYENCVAGYPTRYGADDVASRDRLACVKVEIDCEEGEGL